MKEQIKAFLQDYKENENTILLEEGSKEKNELIQSAKSRGILVANSTDLGVLKTIYAFTTVKNDNQVRLPREEFKKILPQIVGKAMDINHIRKMIVGFYIDYKYIAKEEKAIAYAIFFKGTYPELWKRIKKLQKVGKLSSSFEIWSNNRKEPRRI